MGTVNAVCISEKKGTVKHDIGKCLAIKGYGLANDAHAGSERQVSLLSLESIQAFRERAENKVDIPFGVFGENLVVSGIDLPHCTVGTRIRCGQALLEVTQIGKQCHTNCEIRSITGDCIMPREGVFAKVLEGGYVIVGDAADIVTSRPLTVAVITSSDRAFFGGYEDKSSGVIERIAAEHGYSAVGKTILPDEEDMIYREIVRICDEVHPDVLFTTGGTGFGLRDRVPEATVRAAERNAPGIAEAIRAHSMKITPNAVLSRAVSVIRGRTLIINLPGSPKAVEECAGFVLPLISHGIKLLRGEEDK